MTGKTESFELADFRIERGLTLVEASAGTGKTYSLAGTVLRLLLEGHVSAIGKILVMTFTNAATAELVARIRTLVRDAVVAFETGASSDTFLAKLVMRHGSAGLAVVRGALRDLDDIEVSTIHGFCRRVLEQNALEVGVPFEMEYVESDRPLLERAAESFWRRTVYPAGPVAARVVADREVTPQSWTDIYLKCRSHPRLRFAPDALPLAEAIAGLEAANEGDGPEVEAFVHALRTRFLHDVEPLLEREKRIARTASYDDLLRRLHGRLGDAAASAGLRRALSAQFDAVLVDEFQDTDEIQLDIFEGLFADLKLFYVGDPKQAIYAFRGADVFAYLRAKSRAEHVYTMTANWRSETPLVTAINVLHEQSAAPFVLDDIPFVHVTAAGAADDEPLAGDGRKPFEWLWLGTGRSKDDGRVAACDAVAREMVRLLDPANGARIGAKPVEPQNVAVLVRTNRDATTIQDALARAGVPAVVSQAGSVFESDEASDLAILLRAVLDPSRSGAVRAALATRCFGHDAAEIAAIAEDELRWQEIGEKLDEIRGTWLARGFAAMASRLLDVADARANLLSLDRGQRRLTNLLHLIELGQQAIVELSLSPDGLAAWLAERIAEKDSTEKDVAELRLESDSSAVQIVTIHKSKGLEYDLVFLPFMWDAREQGENDAALVHVGGEVVYHFPKLPDGIARARATEVASEDARVAYVALTRARHRCYVAWGAFGKLASRNTALARLVDPSLPANLAERSSSLKQDAREALATHWRKALGALCARHSELMALRDHDPSVPAAHWHAPARPTRALSPEKFPTSALAQLEPWRVASFSSLAGARTVGPATRTVAERPDYVDPEREPLPTDATPRGIFAFARGARAGTCLHAVFEDVDFTRSGDSGLEAIVVKALRDHGFAEKSAHRGEIDPVRDVTAMVRDVLTTTLPGETFALATVSRARKLSEWQFYLPMATVSAAGFAEVFERHGAAPATANYIESLRSLGDRRVEGFLTGFVDVVFENGGRFGIVDWKSNHLGNDVRAYGDAAIAAAMREHHYVLQYHLYVLALHRYLARRVPSYDYDRHVSGVYYAFVRGIRPGADEASATGWYRDCPSRELVEALDELVAGSAQP